MVFTDPWLLQCRNTPVIALAVAIGIMIRVEDKDGLHQIFQVPGMCSRGQLDLLVVLRNVVIEAEGWAGWPDEETVNEMDEVNEAIV